MNLCTCTCAHPRRISDTKYCGRCYLTIAPSSRRHRPPSGSAAPSATAGERRPSTPSPATLDPWETDPTDDYADAYSDERADGIRAIFERGTGR